MTHQNVFSTSEWMPDDEMGHGYDMMIFDQGEDYSGKVRCTVIRKPSRAKSERGVLYIHGFSDYFFQREMAEEFASHGYNFYAVDLRKYGRSIMPGQRKFEARDLREYFDDIRAGLAAMEQDGVREVVLMGHSTGGLTCSLFMQTEPVPQIKALVLNSPFLAWNLKGLKGTFGVPVLKTLGKVAPDMPVKSDKDDSYARSLSADYSGEWKYRRDWKPDSLPDVDAAWVRAVDIAQQALKSGGIKVPVLLMHSDKSAYPGDGPEAYATSDGILNVDKIKEAGARLGPHVTDVTIHDGLHDLVLSRPEVRRVVFSTIFIWLDKLFATHKP